jgi:hypothetical protein
MGATASAITIFEYSYVQERAELRQQLIEQFEKNPQNRDLLHKIKALRSLLVQHPDICATARDELQHEREVTEGPTTAQSAYIELDRLFTIYETSTILKSTHCRAIGNVACPLGHHAAFIDDFCMIASSNNGNNNSSAVCCNICEKVASSGYHCSYCAYSLCEPCSVVYCCNGHAMRLWTHAEAQLTCVLCAASPITRGYRCTLCSHNNSLNNQNNNSSSDNYCGEYDICDLCTWTPGRRAVQQVIFDRMEDDLRFIAENQAESATAVKTIALHRQRTTGGGMSAMSYATTKQLFDFSQDLKEIREVVWQEVVLTRITRDILSMRALLVYGKKYSKTAQEEAQKEGNFTAVEQARLRHLVQWTDHLKSFAVRCEHTVSCPLAHAMFPFEGLPDQYLRRRDVALATHEQTMTKRSKRNKQKDLFTAVCHVCDRVAASGFHCDFCEYDLCHICSKVYCGEGHQMIMWTEPYGRETCFLCQATPLTTGYRCRSCHVDMCDMCTSLEGRNKIRNNWEGEMHSLIDFMKEHKHISDVAMYYHWRHLNEIVSLGFLIEYVRELREAKVRAERQIVQKPIIDKIKLLRAEITKHADLCATAAREAQRTENYVFSTKRKASDELLRLISLVQVSAEAQDIQRRLTAGIGCPLGHAMEPIVPRRRDIDEGTVMDESDAMAAMYPEQQEQQQGQKQQQEELLPETSLKQSEQSHPDAVVPFDTASLPVSPIKFSSAPHTSTSSSSSSVFTVSSSKRPPGKAQSVSVPSPPLPGSSIINNSSSSELDTQRLAALQSQKDRLASLISDSHNDNNESVFDPFDGRTCRVCATSNLYEGMTCSFCEYDLCVDCRVVYCRLGHPCRIWTLPDAETMSCEVCKKESITSGYRCLICDVDICDMCTTKDSRNAYLLWPRRELHRIMTHLDNMSNESATAHQYMKQLHADPDKSFLVVMSKLCKKLQELEEVQKVADEEVKNRLKSVKVRKYGLSNREML